MIDDPHTHPCDEHSDNLAELALGILTGRERAATLVHVDSCTRCAEELEQLSRVADAVVTIAPGVEPPVGFEVRLFSRMGLAEAAPPVTSIASARRRPKGFRWLSASPPLDVGRGCRGDRPCPGPQSGVVDRVGAWRHDTGG